MFTVGRAIGDTRLFAMDPIVFLRTRKSVRLLAPSYLNGFRWVAEDYTSRKRFSLPLEGALVLIHTFKEQAYADVISYANHKLGLDADRAALLVHQLMDKSLLVVAEEEEPRERWMLSVGEKWSQYGWVEAAEYHVATYDYPFIPVDQDGFEEARNRMLSYSEQEPDRARAKLIENALHRLPLGRPKAEHAPASLKSVIKKQRSLDKDVGLNDLLAAILISFGSIGTIQVSWNGEPLLRRTSPSGGARHPTEAYLLAISVPGLPSGWYHFAFGRNELELIREEVYSDSRLHYLFPATYSRAPFDVAAIIVLTSVFERNMYRYREPRTFRAIHMDAGHLAETLSLASAANGLRCFVQYANRDEEVEKELGLNPLEEGVMLACALG